MRLADGEASLSKVSKLAAHIPSMAAQEVDTLADKEWCVRLAMSRIPGEPLVLMLQRSALQQQNRPPEEVSSATDVLRLMAEPCRVASELLAQLGPALQDLSKLAYHRDVNPRNILVDGLGVGSKGPTRFGLVDFGMAVDVRRWHGTSSTNQEDGGWKVLEVGGDCRYWPLSSWLMFMRGPQDLPAGSPLRLEYQTALDRHALGITALQVLVELSPALAESELAPQVGRLMARLRYLQDVWNMYWEDVSVFWMSLIECFSSGGDWMKLKASCIDGKLDVILAGRLLELRSALEEVGAACIGLPKGTNNCEELEVLLRTILALLSDAGTELADPTLVQRQQEQETQRQQQKLDVVHEEPSEAEEVDQDKASPRGRQQSRREPKGEGKQQQDKHQQPQQRRQPQQQPQQQLQQQQQRRQQQDRPQQQRQQPQQQHQPQQTQQQQQSQPRKQYHQQKQQEQQVQKGQQQQQQQPQQHQPRQQPQPPQQPQQQEQRQLQEQLQHQHPQQVGMQQDQQPQKRQPRLSQERQQQQSSHTVSTEVAACRRQAAMEHSMTTSSSLQNIAETQEIQQQKGASLFSAIQEPPRQRGSSQGPGRYSFGRPERQRVQAAVAAAASETSDGQALSRSSKAVSLSRQSSQPPSQPCVHRRITGPMHVRGQSPPPAVTPRHPEDVRQRVRWQEQPAAKAQAFSNLDWTSAPMSPVPVHRSVHHPARSMSPVAVRGRGAMTTSGQALPPGVGHSGATSLVVRPGGLQAFPQQQLPENRGTMSLPTASPWGSFGSTILGSAGAASSAQSATPARPGSAKVIPAATSGERTPVVGGRSALTPPMSSSLAAPASVGMSLTMPTSSSLSAPAASNAAAAAAAALAEAAKRIHSRQAAWDAQDAQTAQAAQAALQAAHVQAAQLPQVTPLAQLVQPVLQATQAQPLAPRYGISADAALAEAAQRMGLQGDVFSASAVRGELGTQNVTSYTAPVFLV
eukprot:TRINITY_DN16589_c1_g1_i1.p1 TRINITY_DN16589_c1_g1~~TRINITY_DN16589_c1_g1_i1.p1  ORF type:complete len:975 (+),score=240.21 TRINITY_DN16589_c1_g1_i1:1011-3935(+)